MKQSKTNTPALFMMLEKVGSNTSCSFPCDASQKEVCLALSIRSSFYHHARYRRGW